MDEEEEVRVTISDRHLIRVLTVLVVLFAVAIILLLLVLFPPASKTWQAKTVTSYTSLLRKGLPPTSLADWAADVEESDYSDFLTCLAPVSDDQYGDPWLFAALVLGYLRLHNVPLWEPGVAALYSTQTRDVVITEEGDSWKSLAAEYAGNEQLWPLLWLLNREWIEKRGISLDAGRRIWVPFMDRLPNHEPEDAK